jgi:hypothetical protein
MLHGRWGNTYDPPVKAPPITVKCDCGQVRWLAYGDRWQCEECGRSWNTAQIPEQEYRALQRAVRRYELQSLVFAGVLLAIFAPLIVFVDVRLGITGMVVFFFWSFMLRPHMRRRLLARVLGSARWQLRPE